MASGKVSELFGLGFLGGGAMRAFIAVGLEEVCVRTYVIHLLRTYVTILCN